jgi:formamidopyrimidine-DNA glycosylase
VPELPEVETVRRDLANEFAGQRVKRAEVSGRRSVRRHGHEQEFIERLEGRRIDGVGRRGKYLVVALDNGDVLVVHLGMSGQLLRAGAADPLPKHAHVVITFSGGAQLRFVDPRTFGQLFVTSGETVELAHLGPDPLVALRSPDDLAGLLGRRRSRLKPLLMDQRFLAGIGNIYSDEVLFSAGLRHDRTAETLSGEEVARLYRSLIATLHEAIACRGSSLADEQYRDLFGRIGSYQALHRVYDREGRPCPTCRAAIVRVKANGRSTFYCERCQV